ncbi:MAG: PorP/SprF family type IX secretion system membrane protein [Saprospiraceae bacterium]|nr:PorP/SprF family type IX secretion system membrane protein [Saprospiraceae bacterium]
MNKIFSAFAFMLISVAFAQAQQMPLFTQYREMQGAINPASINYGFFTDRHNGSVGISFRRQWLDMQGPPTTQILRGEYFWSNYTGVTILAGGYLMNDQTGPTGFTGLYGRIAGVVTSDAEYSGLSLGLAAGGVQYRVKTSEIKVRDLDDIRATQDRTQLYPDLSIGAFWYQRLDGLADEDYVYAGVSVPQIMGLDLSVPTGVNNQEVRLQRVQHYYAQAGWYHFFGEGSFVEPSVWLRYVPNTPLSIDMNVRYQAGNNFWVGAGGSIRGMIHAEAGFILGKNLGYDTNIKFGYGFDYSTQTYGPFVGTTHEVNLSFAF